MKSNFSNQDRKKKEKYVLKATRIISLEDDQAYTNPALLAHPCQDRSRLASDRSRHLACDCTEQRTHPTYQTLGGLRSHVEPLHVEPLSQTTVVRRISLGRVLDEAGLASISVTQVFECDHAFHLTYSKSAWQLGTTMGATMGDGLGQSSVWAAAKAQPPTML